MIQAIYYFLFALTLLYGLYFLFTSFFAFFDMRKDKIKKSKPKYKFGVLIAARNEAEVIGNLVKSLKAQNYPKDMYEIFVIANNCTDNTAEVAKKEGATILDCTVPVKTKGDVLKFVFKKLENNKNVDAYIIFDADNVVDKNFITRMNDTLCAGYRVAQGFRDSKNMTDNWLSGSYSLFYYIQNFFFSKSRSNVGLSASINGTGFMVKKDVIKEYGFNPKTLTEDIEFTGQCAINGVRIAFVEDTITYDEQPTSFKASWKQRSRWSIGSMQCSKYYSGKLLKGFFTKGSVACLDMFLNYLAAYFQILGFFLAIVLTLFYLFGVELYDIFSYMFAYGFVFMVVVYLLNILINIFILHYNNKPIKKTMPAIILFTVFILTWIPINIVCLFKKKQTWEPIKHTRSVDIDSINK